MKKKILAVCTANYQRSPTLEAMLNATPGYEAKSAGTHPLKGRTALSCELLQWADRIVVFEEHHRHEIAERFPEIPSVKVRSVDIADDFAYRSPKLVQLIRERWFKQANVWLLTPTMWPVVKIGHWRNEED